MKKTNKKLTLNRETIRRIDMTQEQKEAIFGANSIVACSSVDDGSGCMGCQSYNCSAHCSL